MKLMSCRVMDVWCHNFLTLLCWLKRRKKTIYKNMNHQKNVQYACREKIDSVKNYDWCGFTYQIHAGILCLALVWRVQ